MNRWLALLVTFLLCSVRPATSAAIKVGGLEFLPKELLFAASDPKSRVSGEGAFEEQARWELNTETRVAQRIDLQNCIRYYYKTTAILIFRPPAPVRPISQRSERITNTPLSCPDASGKVRPPKVEARPVSSGTTPDGKQQDIVEHPDGTRMTIVSDDKHVLVTLLYPDGTADQLRQAAE